MPLGSIVSNIIGTKNDCKYCIVLYCIVLYCIVLYCIVLYCIIIISHTNIILLPLMLFLVPIVFIFNGTNNNFSGTKNNVSPTNIIFKCMKLTWSLKYGVWYSIYSVVIKY